MDKDMKLISDVHPALEKPFEKPPSDIERRDNANQSEGWDELEADDSAQKEAILKLHFEKAYKRFNAGVSLAKIRKHYEQLGAKYSPVTFRKKWDVLVSEHQDQA